MKRKFDKYDVNFLNQHAARVHKFSFEPINKLVRMIMLFHVIFDLTCLKRKIRQI